jgi:hypothetical protein
MISLSRRPISCKMLSIQLFLILNYRLTSCYVFVICRKKLDFWGHLNFEILNIGVCFNRRTFAKMSSGSDRFRHFIVIRKRWCFDRIMKFIHFLLYQRHKIYTYMLFCPWNYPNSSPLGKLFEYDYSRETFKDAACRNIVNANKGTNELVFLLLTCHGHKVANQTSMATRS